MAKEVEALKVYFGFVESNSYFENQVASSSSDSAKFLRKDECSRLAVSKRITPVMLRHHLNHIIPGLTDFEFHRGDLSYVGFALKLFGF